MSSGPFLDAASALHRPSSAQVTTMSGLGENARAYGPHVPVVVDDKNSSHKKITTKNTKYTK